MSDHETSTESPLPAGEFGSWLDAMQAALRGERAADVPCDGCTACCTSRQFVDVEPDDEALAHIPRELLFPAPRRPRGHFVLGYDDEGRCPMLVDGRCSIYAHRPRACRTYDCRVYAATGVEVEDKPLVAARVRRWRFTDAGPTDRAGHDALRRAAAALREREPDVSATEVAVRAVEAFESFR